MKLTIQKAIAGLLVMGASQLTSFALVTDYMSAFDNSTIQPGGPRPGSQNSGFWNIEGSNNGNFASYGVADFSIAALQIPEGEMLSSLNLLSFQFTQSNAGFTNSGGMRFFFTTDTSTIIGNGGGSPLFYDSSAGEGGLGAGQLAPKYELGLKTFVEVATGTVDTFDFTLDGLDPAGMSYLMDLFTNGGTFRLIVAATDATTAATYAGAGSPRVGLDYDTTPVPEPSTVAFVALAGGLLVWRSVRSRRSVLQA